MSVELSAGEKVRVQTSGRAPRHPGYADPLRERFELGRADFVGMGSCEFCCAVFEDPADHGWEDKLALHAEAELRGITEYRTFEGFFLTMRLNF